MPTNQQSIVELQRANEARKATYKAAITDFLRIEASSASRLEKMDALNSLHGAAVNYFNGVEVFVRDSKLLGAHSDEEWIVALAEDCHEVLKTILLYHGDFLRAACDRLDLRYEDYLPGPTSYANMQRLSERYLGDLASNMKDGFSRAGLPVRGFEMPSQSKAALSASSPIKKKAGTRTAATGGTIGSPVELMAVLKAAIKAVPAVRYALGVAGVAAAVAIVGGFVKNDFRVAVFGTLIMFAFMILLVGFARLSQITGPRIQTPMILLFWTVTLLTILCLVILVTSWAFRWPRPLNQMFGARLADPVASQTGRGEFSICEDFEVDHPDLTSYLGNSATRFTGTCKSVNFTKCLAFDERQASWDEFRTACPGASVYSVKRSDGTCCDNFFFKINAAIGKSGYYCCY